MKSPLEIDSVDLELPLPDNEVKKFLSQYTEEQIAQSGYWSCAYADIVMGENPFPKGELAIALGGKELDEYDGKDMDSWYARVVLQDKEADTWFMRCMAKHGQLTKQYVISFNRDELAARQWCSKHNIDYFGLPRTERDSPYGNP